MARVSKTTPAAAAASSRTNVTAPAASAPKSRTRKIKTPPAAASPAPETAPVAARQMAPPAAPKSRTQKTPVAAPPPSPAPTPAKRTIPPGAEIIEISDCPTPSVSSGKKRKRAAASASSPIDVDEIEMWTPRTKIRVDEDCCILSADPLSADKARPVVVPAATDDDFVVLAERGQVACRDFPHARYACAKYPFASTAHESHCEQCFCYVCDIAAPCKTWKGHANYGHCHASDKDKFWMTMRGVTRAKLHKT